jgi:hypothetical protein
MTKKENKKTQVFTYKVDMIVHVIADDETEAKKKLDEQGGIMTKREVELLNAHLLYGEEENK